jgi:hypothetical protein
MTPGEAEAAVRVTIAERIRVDHDLLASLVAAGFDGVEQHDVEMHLKVRADRVVRWLLRCHSDAACGRPGNYRAGEERGHCARTRRQAVRLAGDADAHGPPELLPVRPTYAFSGRAYPRLPDMARVADGVRYLVTLTMPADPTTTGDSYPRLSHYGRYKTAPAIVVADWREELVHLAAHEARHTYQFRHGLSHSEIDAERWAHSRLTAWRTARGLPPPAIGPPPSASVGPGSARRTLEPS